MTWRAWRAWLTVSSAPGSGARSSAIEFATSRSGGPHAVDAGELVAPPPDGSADACLRQRSAPS